MLNLRVQEVHSKDAFFVEDEGAVDDDAGFLGLWTAADVWAIEGLTSPISESEVVVVGESMVTVFMVMAMFMFMFTFMFMFIAITITEGVGVGVVRGGYG